MGVIGRHVPTERDPEPKAYRIKLFTKNETQARSRFWYFIRRLVKMKRSNGEILSVREVRRPLPSVSMAVSILAYCRPVPLNNSPNATTVPCGCMIVRTPVLADFREQA